MTSLPLEGKSRQENGSSAAKQVRKEGLVPCILYGGESNVSFVAPYNAFNKLIHNHEFFTVDLTVDGKQFKAILKAVQFHPVTDRIIHVDFLALDEDRPVIAKIPVVTVGLSRGVQNGGKLLLKQRNLKIKALPKYLVEHFEIDVTKLRLKKSIKVMDLNFEGIEILNSPTLPVVSIIVPREIIEEEEEEETLEGAEGEEGAEGAEGAKEGEGAKKGEGAEAGKPAEEGAKH